MNKYIIIIVVIAVTAIIFSLPALTDQLANGNIIRKIQFTQTLTSTQDLGQSHENEQMAIILSPNNGTIYHGSLTYTASEPVQIVILHQIDKSDVKGQPTWTVDGNTIFAETLVDPGTNAGSYDFTGTALALHSMNSTTFTATVSVDGWIRGPTPEAMQSTETSTEPSLKLSRTSIPVKIPLHKAFFDSTPLYYIITDSNDDKYANLISTKQNWKVQLAPTLNNISKDSLGKVYVFMNGISGNGTHSFQDEVFSSTPSQIQYSPLRSVAEVTWNIGRTPEILDSEQKILDANMTGKVRLVNTKVIMNMPQIIWPNGQMGVIENKTLTDQIPYEDGQILNVDTNNMTVTFVAHRGWGPDGKTIYYIVTDATPSEPAKMMEVTNTPSLTQIDSAMNLYHFTNGIKGSGPFGFQAGISSAQLGESSYSPICKISTVTWKDPSQSMILENMDDINAKKDTGDITIHPANILNNDYIINCPLIDLFK